MLPVVGLTLVACPGDQPLVIDDAGIGRTLEGLGVTVNSAAPQRGEGIVPLKASSWRSDAFDILDFDDEVWRAQQPKESCQIRLQLDCPTGGVIDAPALALVRQVMTRYQRFATTGNLASSGPLFERVLDAHARLHDRSKPLVAADHDHALDTWCWVLRLAPQADLSLQLAALFHDVERLQSEPDRRIEQYAPDYQAFKSAHAAAGSRMVEAILAEHGVPAPVIERTSTLVAGHESARRVDPREDDGHERREAGDDASVLNEADALSFFSLNASGFLKYYGPAHTKRKVAYTWARLGTRGRSEVGLLKLAGEVQAMVGVASQDERAWQHAQTGGTGESASGPRARTAE